MFVMFSFTEELEEASSKIMVWSVFEQFKRFFSMYKDTSQPWWQKCYRSVIHYISAEMTASAGGVIRVMSFLCFVGSLEVYTRDK